MDFSAGVTATNSSKILFKGHSQGEVGQEAISDRIQRQQGEADGGIANEMEPRYPFVRGLILQR